MYASENIGGLRSGMSSLESSPKMSPRPLGDVDDLEGYRDLFYRPSCLPKNNNNTPPDKSNTSLALLIPENNKSTHNTNSGGGGPGSGSGSGSGSGLTISLLASLQDLDSPHTISCKGTSIQSLCQHPIANVCHCDFSRTKLWSMLHMALVSTQPFVLLHCQMQGGIGLWSALALTNVTH